MIYKAGGTFAFLKKVPCFCELDHENIGGKSIIFVQFLKSKNQRNTLIYIAVSRFLWGTKKFPKNTPKKCIDSRNENTPLNNTKFVLCFKGGKSSDFDRWICNQHQQANGTNLYSV